MLRLLSDENVKGAIIRGLRLREPALEITRVQNVGLQRTPDPDILEWAAQDGRVLITADLNTMVGYACDRVKAGQSMPGVLALRKDAAIGQVIDDILFVVQCGEPDDMCNQVRYIPFD